MLTPDNLTSFANMDENRWAQFGRWLQSEREKTGVSQNRLATEAGIHVTQASRIENGHSGVKRDTLIRMVGVLNRLSLEYKIDLDTALSQAGFAPVPSKSEHQLDIAEGVRVALLHADKFTEEDKVRFAIAFKAAYQTALQMIEQDKGDNQ